MKDPQIILSTVLAIATVAYTIINALMLWESRKVRKQKSSPLLIAFLDYPDNKNVLVLHIKNIGEGCARDVKFRVIKDYKRFGKEDSWLSYVNWIKNGMNILPSQHELICYLDWDEKVGYNSTDKVHLEFEYKPLTNKRRFNASYELPFNQMGYNCLNPPASFIGQIPYYLKEQNSTLTKIKEALLKISTGVKSE